MKKLQALILGGLLGFTPGVYATTVPVLTGTTNGLAVGIEEFTLDSGIYIGTDTTNRNAIVIAPLENERTAVQGNNSILIGARSDATEENAIALGTDASATIANSVALGANSVTSAATDVSVMNIGGKEYAVAGNNASTAGVVSLGSEGQEKQLQNVAAGRVTATSTDAVNGSQLYAVGSHLDYLGSQIEKVGAGAAALASLHPLDFDPDEKWSFASGYGNYKGENAMALGAFYRPNESTMFSISGNVGGGENMVGVGISFTLGQKNNVSTSKVAMAKEIKELRQVVSEQGAQIEKLMALVSRGNGSLVPVLDNSKAVNFPDVPQNHWAYTYITTLAGNGIITGYPDGNFKGEQSMTRFEFATLLAKALQKGYDVGRDAEGAYLLQEFKPELMQLGAEYYTVERIAGEDNDRHKIERVRIINKDKATRDVYGGVIAGTGK